MDKVTSSPPTAAPPAAAPEPRLRRVAIMIGAVQPDADLQTNILKHCPIVRMGKGRGHYMERNADGAVFVVPPDLCIGCGICVRKNPDAVMMMEYAW